MEKKGVVFRVSLFLACYAFHRFLGTFIDPQSTEDATYYFLLARSLSSGGGFSENFIWHHLREYQGLIHPIDYWQPLCSIIYSAFFKFGIEGHATIFNHLIWAGLAVAVFSETFKKTGCFISSIFAYGMFSFGSKYAFYLSTTDNIALYALLGFLFFRTLMMQSSPLNTFFSGAIGGLMAFSRIDGLIFSVLGIFYKAVETRSFRVILAGVLGFLLIMSPWMIRNQCVFNTPWISYSQVFFFTQANDLHEYGKVLSWRTYSENGWRWLLQHKLNSLRENFGEFFLVPNCIFLFPFFVFGLLSSWTILEKLTTFFSISFWLICGFFFTEQSMNGTDIHILPALFPWFSIICASGLHGVPKVSSFKNIKLNVAVPVLLFFSLVFSGMAFQNAIRYYSFINLPLKRLMAAHLIPPGSAVASSQPIRVSFLSDNPGVIISSDNAFSLAGKFSCNYILLDKRFRYKNDFPLNNIPKPWHLIASEGPLLLFEGK